ncbi:alkaline phosphatase D family protein [Pandoraea commovens]|uniref:Alkaline phosphatase n=1 Tax=Pandoraea commovens TaxID=2508289 RepID=A0A5E4WY80_9BURK|nr:alkaline phosphatase D family protein [Pandoraea commovens]VVE28860.1 alkaline phosphatase [Pandoraea commovens]
MKRRTFLAGSGLLVGAPAVIIRQSSARSVSHGTRFPFSVASGDPTADAVVLWTRLARDTVDTGPVASTPVNVEWMVATDRRMTKVVRRGVAVAQPMYGHSVHVDVAGLAPDREYWYAFRCGNELSPVGRTRTLPSERADISRFRFNVVSCQNWEQGYFDAYDGMAADDPSFVMHVGDYIYDVSRGGGVRDHERRALPMTLDDYRRRHALYKTDAALRRAHETFPFILTLDNHDGLEDNTTDVAQLNRRAAAYQAWYEFQPVRYAPLPASPAMQIQRGYDIGNLMRLTIPDTRQFRDSETPCASVSDSKFAFGVYEQACKANDAPERSMLGAGQELWLKDRLQNTPAQWNVIASTVKMTPFDMRHNDALYRYLQSWDGYPAERNRILDQITAARVPNPVSLSGDIHSYMISSVVRNVGDDPRTAPMTELVGTSISAQWPEPLDKPMAQGLPLNPHVNYYESQRRGYMRCTVTRDSLLTDLRTIDFTDKPGGTVRTSKRFVVENGKTGAQEI